MGFFSAVDIEIMNMIENGATRLEVGVEFPFLTEDEIERYFTNDHDGDENYSSRDPEGQPDEYTEWQDYMGGDDYDHGQFDGDF